MINSSVLPRKNPLTRPSVTPISEATEIETTAMTADILMP